MPLSDGIRGFLQQIGQSYDLGAMSPEEREQRRQNQQAFGEHQREFGIGQSNKDREFEEQKRQHKQMMDAKMLEYDYEPVPDEASPQQGTPTGKVGEYKNDYQLTPPAGSKQRVVPFSEQQGAQAPQAPSQDINSLMEQLIPGFGKLTGQGGAAPATQQGGPGLNATGPTMGEAPGPIGVPRQPAGDPQASMSNIMPLLSMFGMQGQTGAGMNTPAQQSGGTPTPADRAAPTGGGGVVSPAADETPHRVNFGPGFTYQKRTRPNTDFDVPMPEAFVAAGGPKTLKSSQITAPLAAMIDKYKTTAAPEKLTEPELAIKAQLTAAGINKPLAKAAEENPGAYSTAVRLAAEAKDPTLKGRREAQEIEAAEKAHLSKAKQENAKSLLERIKEEPQAYYGKDVDKDTRSFAEELARQRGEDMFIPKQELTPQRKDLGAYALDVKEMNGELRKITAELYGRDPNIFNALVGRWDETLKKLGTPVSKDPRINYLVGRFKDLVGPMVARETKMAGGGRAAIQMMNMLKESLPSLHDHPDYLGAAFDNTDLIANTSIKSNRHFNYGQYDMSKLVPGDPLKHKGGKTYHFKAYSPDGKIQTVEE